MLGTKGNPSGSVTTAYITESGMGFRQGLKLLRHQLYEFVVIVKLIKSAKRKLLRIVACLSFLIIAIFHASLFEAGLRNLAFIGLVKHFADPPAHSELTLSARTLELFAVLAERDPSRYQPYYQRLRGIHHSFSDSLNQRYLRGRKELELALRANLAGDKSAAEEHLRRALAAGTQPVQLEARLHLAFLLSEQGEFEQSEDQIRAILGSLESFSSEFDGCPGTRLLGGSIEYGDVRSDLPIHVVLVWEREDTDQRSGRPETVTQTGSIDSWHWYEVGQLLFVVGSTPNLIHDGGFEGIVTPRAGLPPNLAHPLYRDQRVQHTKFQYDSSPETSNIVLTLDGQGESAVGVGSSLVPVQDAIPTAYLFAGRYRTAGAAVPRIGARWIIEGAREWDDHISQYAVTQPSSSWTQFSRLMAPPENAEQVQFWTLNADASSRLSVDDLALLRVPLPCGRAAPRRIGS